MNIDAGKRMREIVEKSAYRLVDIEAEFGISQSQMRGYMRGVTPKKNKQKVEIMVKKLESCPRQQKHPSFGYATQEEVSQLQNLGLSPDRDLILKKIADRTKLKGKK